MLHITKTKHKCQITVVIHSFVSHRWLQQNIQTTRRHVIVGQNKDAQVIKFNSVEATVAGFLKYETFLELVLQY